ncbi:hypothetical protein N7486_010583 [Penicillium sp. IBT 16267x]|nr:hypothetical protein N7486_010583 [Penicillium sp. IBT 16267x]
MGTLWPATFCTAVLGYCLHHPAEQRGSLRFLSRVEEVLGWRTAWIKEQLERQWTELAEVDQLNR